MTDNLGVGPAVTDSFYSDLSQAIGVPDLTHCFGVYPGSVGSVVLLLGGSRVTFARDAGVLPRCMDARILCANTPAEALES